MMHPIVLTPEMLSTYTALLVAFVAGAFSLLNLTVSKENKVSEFRQAWIDALRNDISLFVSRSHWIAAQFVHYLDGGMDFASYLEAVRESMMVMNEASTRVKLRLHEEERNPRSLMIAMDALQELLEGAPRAMDSFRVAFGEASKDVEIQTAVVLRYEWNVVKKGERGYRFAKGLAYICLAASVVILALLIIGFLQSRASSIH